MTTTSCALTTLLSLAAQAGPEGDPRVLTGPMFGQKTAPGALRELLRQIEHKTGEAPTVLGGMRGRDGKDAEILCRFNLNGRPTRAQIIASADAGATVMLLDDERTFRANYPRLVEMADQRFRQLGKGPEWSLEPRRLNDGSRIALPASWRITGDNRGMISAEGPEGAIDYGCATQVWSRAMGGGWGVLCADYTTPARMHVDLFPQIAAMAERAGMPASRFVKLNDQARIQSHVGDCEVLDYEWDRLLQGRPVRWRSVALVITRNLGGSAFYYISAVHAPAETFGRDLRQLLRIWGSCQVSTDTQRERLDQAVKSLKEAGRLANEAAAFQRETYDRSFRNWSAAFREESFLRDNQDGGVRGALQVDMEKLAERANQAEGWNRYEVLDPKDVR